MGFEFTIDTVTNDAFVVGNAGASRVVAYRGRDAFTFLEYLESGAVQSTTITNLGPAVHSRNTILGSGLLPSQYYGSCGARRE